MPPTANHANIGIYSCEDITAVLHAHPNFSTIKQAVNVAASKLNTYPGNITPTYNYFRQSLSEPSFVILPHSHNLLSFLNKISNERCLLLTSFLRPTARSVSSLVRSHNFQVTIILLVIIMIRFLRLP